MWHKIKMESAIVGELYHNVLLISVIKEVTVWLPKLLRNGLDFLYNTTPRDLLPQNCLIYQDDIARL